MTDRTTTTSDQATYYVYMVECRDGSIYTGITTNLARRMQEHLSRSSLAARYTKSHEAKKLIAAWETVGRSSASALEYRIKRLSHVQKVEMSEHPESALSIIPGIPRGTHLESDQKDQNENKDGDKSPDLRSCIYAPLSSEEIESIWQAVTNHPKQDLGEEGSF